MRSGSVPVAATAAARRRASAAQLVTRFLAAAGFGGCAAWIAAGGGWPPGALALLVLLALASTMPADSPVPAAYVALLVLLRLWCADVPASTAAWLALTGQVALVMIGHTAVTAGAAWPPGAAVSRAVRRVWLLRGTAACGLGVALVPVAAAVSSIGAAPVVVVAALLLPAAVVAVLIRVLTGDGFPPGRS